MFFSQSRHIDHKRRADKAIQNMAREFGAERVDRACGRAIEAKRFETSFVRELLRNRREGSQRRPVSGDAAVVDHENLRSSEHFGKYLN